LYETHYNEMKLREDHRFGVFRRLQECNGGGIVVTIYEIPEVAVLSVLDGIFYEELKWPVDEAL